MNALNFNSKDENNKFCKPCKKKLPPVDTILKVGENITQYRWKKGKYYCDDCNRGLGKNHRENIRGINAEYERVKYEEQLEDFQKQWNDITFSRTKELADKVVLVWDKYQRRCPENGLTKEIICSVIFSDYWNVTADKVIEDLLNSRNDTATIRMRHKEILMLYIPGVIHAFRKGYRIQAEHKWAGVVDSLNNKYAGHEKIVAKPEFQDQRTKRYEPRWFLLSYEPDLEERTEGNENKKRRIDYNIGVEHRVVQEYTREHAEEIREEATKRSKENSESEDESNQGGDQ